MYNTFYFEMSNIINLNTIVFYALIRLRKTSITVYFRDTNKTMLFQNVRHVGARNQRTLVWKLLIFVYTLNSTLDASPLHFVIQSSANKITPSWDMLAHDENANLTLTFGLVFHSGTERVSHTIIMDLSST